MEKYVLINDRENSRYMYRVQEYTPHIEYKITDGGVIYLTHTRMPQQLQGKGIGTALVFDTLKDIEKQGYKLVPLCGFVAGYIKKNPEWKRLLSEGVYV